MDHANSPSQSWARTGKILTAVVALITALTAGMRDASAWELKVCADPYFMPFSQRDGAPGYDNRIARILAGAIGADLTFLWTGQSRDMTTLFLRSGKCDVIMGVQDGQAGVLSTHSYYRSPFVFVHRADRPYRIGSFDDPALRPLRVGVQTALSPAHEALVNRGLRDNIAKIYEFQLDAIIKDVVEGVIDVGITWGATAGYYAAQEAVPLVVSQVTPEFEPPFRPMFVNIAIGVRIGDESLRDLIDIALAEEWEKVQSILQEYHVPIMPLGRPMISIGRP